MGLIDSCLSKMGLIGTKEIESLRKSVFVEIEQETNMRIYPDRKMGSLGTAITIEESKNKTQQEISEPYNNLSRNISPSKI